MAKNYINNRDLFNAMLGHLERIKEAEAEEKEKPRIPEYIGLSIWKIADGLGKKPNFSGYSFLDEMKSDGIENCMQYLHNFNPEKSQNPFAYFTRIIWFAFLRRIQKEKKQQYIKYKLSMNVLDDNSMTSKRQYSGETTSDHSAEVHQRMAEMAEKFETDHNIKKPAKKKGIEKFASDE